MSEDSEYHAYICIDQGCTAKCISFTRDDGSMTHDEKPCHCLYGGSDVEWIGLDDYLEEMKKLKTALDKAASAIDKLERFTGDE